MKNILIKISDLLKNYFDKKNELIFITEPAEWIIKWISLKLANELKKNKLLSTAVRTTSLGIKNKIIHFSSINTILNKGKIIDTANNNKVILSWFHVINDDIRLKLLPELAKKVDVILTAAQNTKNKLINAGWPENKIIVIPLGINLSIFKPISNEKKIILKQNLKIPRDRIIIGSFQKDGNGWGKGLTPKLIKGPDIFCDVVEKLSIKHKIFIVLTGPARGYVINRLKKSNIPFIHKYLCDYNDIINYYRVLDLYIIASREEGGPQSILESWAAGVPVVSTKVGMVPDISLHKKDILLSEVENANDLMINAETVINNKSLSKKLINSGLLIVQNYSWNKIAKRYYEKIYKHFNKN